MTDRFPDAPFAPGIFDLDGTLVDSEPLANRLFAEHLTACGVPMAAAEAARLFTGLRMPDCYALVQRDFGVRLPADFHDRLQAATFDALRRHLLPVPGAAEMLASLTLPKVVASSSEPEKIDLSLRATGLAGHFLRRFSGTQVARGKPAPDLFLLAASEMGVAPERCFVVEDSDPGVQAGLAAGMPTFALVPPDGHDAEGRRQRLAGAGALVVARLEEIPRRLSGRLAAG